MRVCACVTAQGKWCGRGAGSRRLVVAPASESGGECSATVSTHKCHRQMQWWRTAVFAFPLRLNLKLNCQFVSTVRACTPRRSTSASPRPAPLTPQGGRARVTVTSRIVCCQLHPLARPSSGDYAIVCSVGCGSDMEGVHTAACTSEGHVSAMRSVVACCVTA